MAVSGEQSPHSCSPFFEIMRSFDKIIIHFFLVMALALLSAAPAGAQFTDGGTGLLQMPTAEMQADGTFMVTTNFLNKHSLPKSGWNYNTLQYGICISFWERIEIGYICTIFNGAWDPRSDKSYRQTIMRNQDRHLSAKVLFLNEGDFGIEWMPAVALGVCDIDKGMFRNRSNGYFTRFYAVASKSFRTKWGGIVGHLGYQYSFRADFPMNAPCAGVSWQPKWLQNKGILDHVNVIAEFDSRTVNLGFITSIWDNRFEAMFELQNFQWVNFGLRYKLRLKRIITK